jgi:hypothetical protein
MPNATKRSQLEENAPHAKAPAMKAQRMVSTAALASIAVTRRKLIVV